MNPINLTAVQAALGKLFIKRALHFEGVLFYNVLPKDVPILHVPFYNGDTNNGTINQGRLLTYTPPEFVLTHTMSSVAPVADEIVDALWEIEKSYLETTFEKIRATLDEKFVPVQWRVSYRGLFWNPIELKGDNWDKMKFMAKVSILMF